MDVFDQLALIAEIAVTLLGFIAVFFILSGGSGKFSPDDAHFVHAMVLSASMVIVASLGPRTTRAVADGNDLWREWAIAMFAISVLMAVVVAHKQHQLEFEKAGGLHWVWHVPGWALGLSGGTALAVGAFAVDDASGWYLVGTTLFLLNAIWCFVAVVFRKCL